MCDLKVLYEKARAQAPATPSVSGHLLLLVGAEVSPIFAAQQNPSPNSCAPNIYRLLLLSIQYVEQVRVPGFKVEETFAAWESPQAFKDSHAVALGVGRLVAAVFEAQRCAATPHVASLRREKALALLAASIHIAATEGLSRTKFEEQIGLTPAPV